MSYIKAYSDENKKHSDLYILQCPDNKVEFVLAKLADHFGVNQLKVTWKGRKGGAYYRSFGHVINFTPNKTSWLTVCHEFAHALTDKTRSAKTKSLQGTIDRSRIKRDAATRYDAVWNACDAQIRLLIERRDKITNLKAHSADFDDNVEIVCAYVREQKLHEGASTLKEIPLLFDVPSTALQAHTAARTAEPETSLHSLDLVKRVFDRLPDILWCDKCRKEKPKAEVGVRVMSRTANGVPTKVSRQSYCKVCRSKK